MVHLRGFVAIFVLLVAFLGSILITRFSDSIALFSFLNFSAFNQLSSDSLRNDSIEISEKNESISSTNFKTSAWYVYKDADFADNHGIWSNWMAEKNPSEMMNLSLVDKNNPYSGSTGLKVEVNFNNSSWGGICTSSAPNYWGKTEGPAYDLSHAKSLVFYARTNDNASIQLKVAITGNNSFGDSAKSPAETNWIILTKDWKRYELKLSGTGINLERTITPFCFVTSKAYNDSPIITFQLDEIYFEMED